MSEVVSVETGKMDIDAACKQAFALYKSNIGLLLGSGAVTIVLSALSLGLLSGPISMGMLYACDRLVTGKNASREFGDVFRGFAFLIPGFVLAFGGGMGSLVCGVGLIATMPVAFWTMLRILDTGMNVDAAARDAIDFIYKKGNYNVLIVWLVCAVIGGCGALVCGIGVFVTLPFAFLVLACVYRQVYRA